MFPNERAAEHRTSELYCGFPPLLVGVRPTSPLFHFLTHIQDEVHRFAVSFHRQKRSKDFIHSELERIDGEGGYSRNSEQVLLSVISNRQLPKLEKIAHLIDPTCFMIVSHVTEVSGRGFSLEKDYKEED